MKKYKNRLNWFLNRILQDFLKKNNAWNTKRLVDDSFVPSTQQTTVLDCKLMDFRSHFFYYDKSFNGIRYPFKYVKKFENLLPFERENSIKINLQTANLLAGQFISYKSVKQFWLNFQIKGQKQKLQIDIFWLFDSG